MAMLLRNFTVQLGFGQSATFDAVARISQVIASRTDTIIMVDVIAPNDDLIERRQHAIGPLDRADGAPNAFAQAYDALCSLVPIEDGKGMVPRFPEYGEAERT